MSSSLLLNEYHISYEIKSIIAELGGLNLSIREYQVFRYQMKSRVHVQMKSFNSNIIEKLRCGYVAKIEG